jgi:hypothetical protein
MYAQRFDHPAPLATRFVVWAFYKYGYFIDRPLTFERKEAMLNEWIALGMPHAWAYGSQL